MGNTRFMTLGTITIRLQVRILFVCFYILHCQSTQHPILLPAAVFPHAYTARVAPTLCVLALRPPLPKLTKSHAVEKHRNKGLGLVTWQSERQVMDLGGFWWRKAAAGSNDIYNINILCFQAEFYAIIDHP